MKVTCQDTVNAELSRTGGRTRVLGRLIHIPAVLVFLAVLLPLASMRSDAAEIKVDQSSLNGISLVSVEGELIAGDEKKFAQVALQNDAAIVIFHSPGGSTWTGIEIGRAIRLKGFLTYVPAGAICSSACGYAWLAGVQRFMEPTSRIGFHASYVRENGVNKESGVGNAIVGAYLNSLGLSQNAIAYISTAPPDSMTWMSLEDAEEVGIEVKVVDGKGDRIKREVQASPDPDDDTILVAPLGPPSGQPRPGVSPPALPPPVAVRERKMSLIPGADIFGHDLPGMPLKNLTAFQCEEACIADRRCQAFTFNTRHNVCFLKADGQQVFRNPNAQAGYMSAIQSKLRRSNMTIMERTDFPGNDYRELKDIGFGECSDACESDQRCRAFTYMSKRQRCWLKDDAADAAPSKITISGMKD